MTGAIIRQGKSLSLSLGITKIENYPTAILTLLVEGFKVGLITSNLILYRPVMEELEDCKKNLLLSLSSLKGWLFVILPEGFTTTTLYYRDG